VTIENKRCDWSVFFSIALLLISGIAGAASSADEYFKKANSYLEKNSINSAVIELKNALKRDPGHVRSRLMLGNIYLNIGDGPSAEKEFRRVSKLHIGRDRWQAELVRALLMQGKFGEILENYNLEPEDSEALKAELLALRGLAYQGGGEFQKAEKAYRESMQLNPDNLTALIATAQLANVQNNQKKAENIINQVLEKEPDNIQALGLRGDLARQARRFDEAEKDFSKILQINPNHFQARVLRASIHMAKMEFDKVSGDLDIAAKQRPGNSAVLYMQALLAFQANNLDSALETLQLILRDNPQHIQSQWFYGMISYTQGDWETAENYINRVLVAVPSNLQAVKLLATIRMKLKVPKQAIGILKQALEKHPDDPQLMAMLGSAYLHSGDQEKGAEMLGLAVELEPDLAALRTELALGLLAKGDTEKAIVELKFAVNLGQGLLQADILLVLSHLKKQEFEKALQVSMKLEERMPESPIPFNLTGMAYLAKGEKTLAGKQFEKALKIDPKFHTAEMNLARIDTANNDVDKAEGRYKSILKQSVSHLGAMLGLAALSERQRDNSAVEQWLTKAQESNPKELRPGVLLAQFYLKQKQPLKALQVADLLSREYPDNILVLQVLGNAQIAVGEISSAIRSFELLAEQQSDVPQAWLLLGRAQLMGKYLDKARTSFQHALTLNNRFTQAQVMLVGLELEARNYDVAEKLADELIKNHPELAVGYEVNAAVLEAKKQPEKALIFYAKGYDVQPSARLAGVLSQRYSSQGQPTKATAILQDWLKNHPEDAAIHSMLGMQLQFQKRNTEAITSYESALAVAPDNLLVLNNLAWIYQEKGDKRALELAEKAYNMAPDKPEIADTYGWVLVSFDRVEKALPILQQAMMMAPENPEISYHVAYALYKSERRGEAKTILEKNIKDYPASSIATKVQELLNKLK